MTVDTKEILLSLQRVIKRLCWVISPFIFLLLIYIVDYKCAVT